MNEMEMRIPGYEDLEDFLLHCQIVSESEKPHFPREEVTILYDLMGISLEEIYKKYSKRIPERIEVNGDKMEKIFGKIMKRNPDILYN